MTRKIVLQMFGIAFLALHAVFALAGDGETRELRSKRGALLRDGGKSLREVVEVDDALIESYEATIRRIEAGAYEREMAHRQQKLLGGLFMLLFLLVCGVVTVLHYRIRAGTTPALWYRSLAQECVHFFLFPLRTPAVRRPEPAAVILIFGLLAMAASLALQLALLL